MNRTYAAGPKGDEIELEPEDDEVARQVARDLLSEEMKALGMTLPEEDPDTDG
jgi:hypothetical protein